MQKKASGKYDFSKWVQVPTRFHFTLVMTDREQKGSDPTVWLSQRVVMTTSLAGCPVAIVAPPLP
jgi:hypothetical protein